MPQIDPTKSKVSMPEMPPEQGGPPQVVTPSFPGARGENPFFDVNFGGGAYQPKPQPQTTARGGTPAYYLPPNQLYPLQIRPIENQGDWDTVRKELYKQLIPTSVNLRNYGLQQLLQQMNVPMEQLYAAQGAGAAADVRNQQMDATRASQAARGIYGSGPTAERNLVSEMGYVEGVGTSAMAARDQENVRQNALLQQLFSVPETDLRFYQAIRSGAIPSGSLWSEHARDYGMMMYGTGTAIRKGAMAAAGAAGGGEGGGMGMDALGNMGGGGGGMGGFDLGSIASGTSQYSKETPPSYPLY